MIRGVVAPALALAFAASVACAGPAASSDDGRWRVEGQGAAVVVSDGGRAVKTLPAARLDGREPSAVSDVRFLPQRRSFVMAFEALAEVWELSVDPNAPPLHDGLVHDYRMGEAIASPGFLGVRRTPLEAPVRTLAVDARGGPYVLARSADGAWLLINLDVRRAIGRYVVGDRRE